MKAKIKLLITTALLVLVVSAAAGASPTHAALADRLAATLDQSSVARMTSVYVWDQRSREVLYSRAANRLMTPASTIKLLTSAAALTELGPDHRFKTRIALNGTQNGSTFKGDIWLVGGGDPSLSTFGFRRINYEGKGSNLASLILPIRSLGITKIQGSIRVDDDMFDEVRWAPTWKKSFRLEEAGALGALTVNQSSTGGAASQRNPDIQTGEMLRTLLDRQGVSVTGSTRSGSMPKNAQIAGTISSPPLIDLVAHMTTTSDNFFAEILLKHVGVEHFKGHSDGSTSQGTRAALLALKRAGINTDDIRWKDGSGLAYSNRVTARTLGHVLGIGAQAPWGEQWIRGFANSGRAGTLRYRLTRRPYYGRIWAKTGTLRHTSALAGFTHRVKSNRRIGFVVLTYDSRGRQLDYGQAHRIQDKVAMILTR